MSFLYDYQEEAVEKLKNGSILCGGVGSGKSRTGIAYYFIKECGGQLDPYSPMTKPKDLYIITTARDTWSDYIPVFVANGFYKNRTEFKNRHIVMSPYSKFPKIERYLEEGRLNRLRREILVTMDFKRQTEAHFETILVDYDKVLLKTVMSQRWDIYKDEPIKNASQYGFVLRKIVNSDESRGEAILELCKDHPKIIVFYNFDYELDILKSLPYEEGTIVSEWNGHVHELIPKADKWIYLVNYGAGSEGWNCIETDTIVFYSLNHSYRVMTQASGRIDRLNTPYKDLYYYRLKSSSWIDMAIARALAKKKDFNIRAYY